jgi:hypothetical protein
MSTATMERTAALAHHDLTGAIRYATANLVASGDADGLRAVCDSVGLRSNREFARLVIAVAGEVDTETAALTAAATLVDQVILDDLDPDTIGDAELPRTRGHAATLANRAEALLLTRMQTEAKARGILDAMKKAGL